MAERNPFCRRASFGGGPVSASRRRRRRRRKAGNWSGAQQRGSGTAFATAPSHQTGFAVTSNHTLSYTMPPLGLAV